MLKYCCTLVLIGMALVVQAAEPPEPLGVWKQWILDGQDAALQCPHRMAGDKLERQCVWAERLELDVGQQAVDFNLTVTTGADTWVQLPGNRRLWPDKVSVDGKQLAPLGNPRGGERAGAYPGLLLDAGRHRIVGRIPLSRSIQSLPLPPHRGLVDLRVNGRQVENIDIDRNHVLWLQRQSVVEGADDRGDAIRLKVYRKLIDSLPAVLETRLELSVSGRAREMSLGQMLPDETVLTQFHSELPARVESDGQLKIQLRAGRWVVHSRARYLHNPEHVGFVKRSPEWPEHEIWAFEARPALRAVKLSGAHSIDPSQLAGPSEWRQLPTYRLASQQELTIEELYRGEVNPPANSLALRKTIWMNFDRAGAVVRDELSGTMASGWRLSAADDVSLGRAAVNGNPQVITRLADGSRGVEIRDAQLSLETVSRLDDARAFSASGWREDVDALSASLMLPPGWQLWHVAGPDDVSDSWLSRWDLWDLFICLLVVATTVKVLGRRWGGLAVFMLALVYHDAMAPLALCTLLLFGLAFLRLLPENGFRRAVLFSCYGLSLIVAAAMLDFFVEAIRQCIYPQLEYRQAINAGPYASGDFTSRSGVPELEALSAPVAGKVAQDMVRRKTLADGVPASASIHPASPEKIQTGPGLPTWQWHRAELRWSGPVSAEEQVALYVSPPPVTRLLRLLQVLLMALFVGKILTTLWRSRVQTDGDGDAHSVIPAATAVLALILVSPWTVPGAVAEGVFPPRYLLEDYKKRLLKAPECASACYAVNQVAIALLEERLQLRLAVSVADRIGVPLPRFPESWQPDLIELDGAAADQLYQAEGQWYLLLDRGVHKLRIEGQVNGDEFRLEFADAHNVAVEAPAWKVTGLTGNRLQSGSLTLSRKLKAQQSGTLFPDPIAAHVAVYRRLVFDQDWQVHTTVRRIAPLDGPIHIRVPLLEGETIRVAGFEPEQGQLAVSLGSRQRQVVWQSAIEPGDSYTLVNLSGPDIAEHWSIEASPRWRLETEGLTPIKSAGSALQHWRPRPGETLSIRAARPQPVVGDSVTVESASWHYKPGDRSSLALLQLTIRSSIGQDYEIRPPVAATLEKLLVDGEERVLPVTEGAVVVALRPGVQTVRAQWRIGQGVATTMKTPELVLASPPSNIDLEIDLPRDRWPLLAGGPAMGPALLYWGVLLVMLLVGAVLGFLIKRQRLTIPLNTWQWVLLILGMSTVNAVGSLWVFAWFFALEARGRLQPTGRLLLAESRLRFNLMQLGLALLTVMAAGALLLTIPQSLLSYPDMQVMGNGSTSAVYRWYQDYSEGALPTAWVFSVPIWVYRAVMLLWSLWLVFALMRWVRWAWDKFRWQRLWRVRAEKGNRNEPAAAE